MGPHIPLNFFMTRLLFMEQSKVNSLKAKSDKASVEIVMDNPRILPEKEAKSFPAVPFPPAAPESPVPVEGWKGVKVGGWINLRSSSNSRLDPSVIYAREQDDDGGGGGDDGAATATAVVAGDFGNLKVDDGDDDDTDITEESSAAFEQITPLAVMKPGTLEERSQHFPVNTARNKQTGMTSSGSHHNRRASTGSTTAAGRPSTKKKNSRNTTILLKMGGDKDNNNNSSSPASSGAED